MRKTVLVSSTFLMALVFFTPLVQASQEIIDSDTNSGTKLKVSAVLYKDVGEIDPNWDYYAIKVTIEDIYAKNNPWKGPMYADIWIYIDQGADEVPTNHKPKAGWAGGEYSFSFSFMGIGFSGQAPAYGVSYETRYWTYLFSPHWSFSGELFEGHVWWFIFSDYAEAAVGVRVAQGAKPGFAVAARVAWYRLVGIWFIYVTDEYVGGVFVGPPGATPIPEPLMPPAPDYPRILRAARRPRSSGERLR